MKRTFLILAFIFAGQTFAFCNLIDDGAAREAAGDVDGAMADYTKAIEMNQNAAVAYTSRGNDKCLKGDFAGAIADCDKAIELKPDLAGAYCDRGNARLQTGELTNAIVDYDKAIELKTNFAE